MSIPDTRTATEEQQAAHFADLHEAQAPARGIINGLIISALIVIAVVATVQALS